MTELQGLLYGLSVALTPENLLACFIGAAVGTAVGVLPGLGPTASLALLLPLTFGFPPATGLIMLAGIYYGSLYGGSTTAILMNIPGEAASIVTAIDGHEMTKRGRAGAALTVAAVGSFIAGTIGVCGVVLFAPTVAGWALSFGPPEFFALMTVGLVVLSRVSGGSFAAAMLATALGLLLSTVGVEGVSGVRRFDFGFLPLAQGFDIAPVAVGLFGIAEMFFLIEDLAGHRSVRSLRFRELLPSAEEWRRSIGPWLRGSVLGWFIGLLPGPAATTAAFASYQLEKTISPRKEEFGKGAVEGVAGPEAANNGAGTSTFVALLALGLPFTSVTALLLAAMQIQGVQPGPLLISTHPEIFWGVVVSMYVGNVMLVILNLPLIGIWVKMLEIPVHLLCTGILLFAVIGSYGVRNSVFDLWTALLFGVIGYFLRKLHFPLASLILAIILGPLIEKHFRESLFLSLGDPTVFIGSPIVVAIWVLGALVVAVGVRGQLAKEIQEGEE